MSYTTTDSKSILESIKRRSNQLTTQKLEAFLQRTPCADLFEAYQSFFNIENREPVSIPPEHKQCIIAEIDEELKSLRERQTWLESMKSSIG